MCVCVQKKNPKVESRISATLKFYVTLCFMFSFEVMLDSIKQQNNVVVKNECLHET